MRKRRTLQFEEKAHSQIGCKIGSMVMYIRRGSDKIF